MPHRHNAHYHRKNSKIPQPVDYQEWIAAERYRAFTMESMMIKHPFTPRMPLLAVAIVAAFTLTACQAPAPKASVQPPAAAATPANVQQNALGDGLYEMAYSQPAQAIFVASAQSFKGVNGGIVYRLNPTTLALTGTTHTDLKNFGMAIDPAGTTLYLTNTLDGGVTAVDTATGKVKNRLLIGDKNQKGTFYGAREIIYHDGALYVGGVRDPGVIWVVDAKTLELKSRIKNAGKWVTGLLWSPTAQRIYAANGGGEILVINPRNQQIEARWRPDDGKEYLFLNLAEDPATGRLFVTDNSKAKTTLVFDEHSGKVIKQLDTGDALGIKFNPVRNELYITQRAAGKVLQVDATSYAVKQSWTFEPHPNSLLVSPDGQTLYVTVKQDLNKDTSSKGPDKVVRIPLNPAAPAH